MDFSNLLKVDLTPAQIIFSFLIAFALGFLWATVYRKTHTGIAYTRSFFLTLLLIPSIVAMVMMAIGTNLALSLGLVGSLSVIRFRTVIKDTKDMAFLFFTIGIGLCCGSNAWMVAIIGTVTVSLIVITMLKIDRVKSGTADYILTFRSNVKDPWSALAPETKSLLSWKQLRGTTNLNGEDEIEYTYNVRLSDKKIPERVVGELSNGVLRRVALISPDILIELW